MQPITLTRHNNSIILKQKRTQQHDLVFRNLKHSRAKLLIDQRRDLFNDRSLVHPFLFCFRLVQVSRKIFSLSGHVSETDRRSTAKQGGRVFESIGRILDPSVRTSCRGARRTCALKSFGSRELAIRRTRRAFRISRNDRSSVSPSPLLKESRDTCSLRESSERRTKVASLLMDRG